MAKPKSKVLTSSMCTSAAGCAAAHDARYELGEVGEAFGLTFQQAQKYEKGVNRMGSSRLQRAAEILDVSVPFFFVGAPGGHEPNKTAPSPAHINEFVSSEDGLRLIKAFIQIARPAVRHRIVNLVQEIAGDGG